MKTITIAFDCDGTLLNNTKQQMVANEQIRSLLVILACFKNTKIIVWSGGGEAYARQVARALGIEAYVDAYTSKNYKGKDENHRHIFSPSYVPDIAIDDIQDCELGLLNLIVKEK